MFLSSSYRGTGGNPKAFPRPVFGRTGSPEFPRSQHCQCLGSWACLASEHLELHGGLLQHPRRTAANPAADTIGWASLARRRRTRLAGPAWPSRTRLAMPAWRRSSETVPPVTWPVRHAAVVRVAEIQSGLPERGLRKPLPSACRPEARQGVVCRPNATRKSKTSPTPPHVPAEHHACFPTDVTETLTAVKYCRQH